VQKLDPNSLFSIFEQGDEQVYQEHNLQSLLQDPYVVVGTVVTGVENFYLIDKIYSLRFKQDYQNIREGIRLKYYNKLYNYLLEISSIDSHLLSNIATDFDIDRSIHSLTDMLYFFQGIEHYEKCAVIKKFTDLLYNKKLELLI
jgi:hypothetical protein